MKIPKKFMVTFRKNVVCDRPVARYHGYVVMIERHCRFTPILNEETEVTLGPNGVGNALYVYPASMLKHGLIRY